MNKRGKVAIGPIKKIRKDSATCGLCHLVQTVMDRRGTRFLDGRPIPEDDDNVEISFNWYNYSSITESLLTTAASSRLFTDVLFVTRSLALSVSLREDAMIDQLRVPSEQDVASYYNITHVGHIDDVKEPATIELGPDGNVMGMKSPKMPFGARRRPETVDTNLLRYWIKLCETTHDLTCDIEDELASSQKKYVLQACTFSHHDSPANRYTLLV